MVWGLVAESKPYFQVMLEQLSGLHVGTGETNSASRSPLCFLRSSSPGKHFAMLCVPVYKCR